VLPTAVDDERLVPGYADVGPHDETDDVDTFDALVNELWLGRPRVLSEYGRSTAAERWYDGDRGPHAPIARAADLNCSSCGFLVLTRGALSRVFGICANEYAPDDGHVVSFDHGCGAHSEALVLQTEPMAEDPDAIAGQDTEALDVDLELVPDVDVVEVVADGDVVEIIADAAPVEVAPDDVAPDDVAPDDVASDDVASDDVAPDEVASDDVTGEH
ncbi:MAG: hypothetical protein QOJ62_2348, partial [Actinomycetota bacterium]|nr:hypothetical protein [Actinomycetota bacterium]